MLNWPTDVRVGYCLLTLIESDFFEKDIAKEKKSTYLCALCVVPSLSFDVKAQATVK